MRATSWTIEELEAELQRFECEARAAGLTEKTVQTYTDRPRRFLRWLAGDYQFKGHRA